MTIAAPVRAATASVDYAEPRLVRRVSVALARPVVASLVLLLTYFALSFANDPRGYLGTDTGGKIAALHAMVEDGDLDPDIGYWAAAFDPDGDLHPLALTRHIEGRWLSVTTLPMLYAAVPLHEVGGLRAVVLLPMLGAVLTALAARALARRLSTDGAHDRGMAAFWAVGLVTPVAIYALDFWEHSLGLAAMLWGVVLLLDAARANAPARNILAGGALFGVAATMRTEALVYAAVAVAVVAGSQWLHTRAFKPVVRVGALASVGLVAPLVANLALERAVLGTAFRAARASRTALGPGGGGGSRVKDSLTTAVGLNHFRPELDWLFGAGIAAMVVFCVVLFGVAERDRRRLAVYPLIGATFLYLLRFGGGLGFVPGLLTASPLAAGGLALAWRRPAFRVPVAIALGALPLVWFFQYSGGANPQWGGRYVLLSGALLAIIAVVGAAAISRAGRVAVIALALVVTGCGVAWLSVRSHGIADALETIAQVKGPVVSAEYHLLREGGAFYESDRPWLTAPRARDIPRAAGVVEQAGYDRFTLVSSDRGRRQVQGFERASARTIEVLPGFEVVLTAYERS